jgi:hypothetical protein
MPNNLEDHVRFQVLTAAASMMFRVVFWVILHGSITQKTTLNNLEDPLVNNFEAY